MDKLIPGILVCCAGGIIFILVMLLLEAQTRNDIHNFGKIKVLGEVYECKQIP